MNKKFQDGQRRESHVNHQKISMLLTRGAEQLDEGILSALRDARTLALQKQRVFEPVFSLNTIGHRAHNLIPHSAPQWVITAIFVAAVVFGITDYWHNTQDHQGSQLDIEILTSDLPIDVFVDK